MKKITLILFTILTTFSIYGQDNTDCIRRNIELDKQSS